MIRKLSLFVLVAALTASACGRQVTPNPGNINASTGLQSGFMEIKFTVAAPFDFTSTRYLIVFNTTGTGGTPYADNFANYTNYSFAFVVGGNGTTVEPLLYQYVNQGNGGAVAAYPMTFTPQQVIFNPNSNGQGTQFSITFDRTLFNGEYSTPTPSSGATTAPTTSSSPSGSPTPAPLPTAGQNYSNTLYVNFFTAGNETNSTALDALGLDGAQDTSYAGGPYYLNQEFDLTINVPAGATQAAYAAAQIAGGEIINQP